MPIPNSTKLKSSRACRGKGIFYCMDLTSLLLGDRTLLAAFTTGVKQAITLELAVTSGTESFKRVPPPRLLVSCSDSGAEYK